MTTAKALFDKLESICWNDETKCYRFENLKHDYLKAKDVYEDPELMLADKKDQLEDLINKAQRLLTNNHRRMQGLPPL